MTPSVIEPGVATRLLFERETLFLSVTLTEHLRTCVLGLGIPLYSVALLKRDFVHTITMSYLHQFHILN